MTISASQQIDYLWKKIGYGAAKTDIPSVLDATNEPFPSPLQIRADKILQQSSLIPNVIPNSSTGVVTVYPTTAPIQCFADTGASTNRSWETGQTFWIPPEFGSTYQIKAWIAPTGNVANAATKGVQVFATGSGNNDEWFFDYQAGILNFIGTNLPSTSFTGNSVYISGAVYSGTFGLPNVPSLGNITFNGDTISTSDPAGNIFITASGTGIVQVTGNTAFGIPFGTTGTRPGNPLIGFTRFNTDSGEIEFWNGNAWVSPNQATVTSDIIAPDGVSNVFTLSSSSTTTGVMVSINGTLQQPYSAYNVSNNSITFTEIPLTTDSIEVRHIAVGALTVTQVKNGTTQIYLDTANVNITGNVLPSSNVAYDLGSPSLRWRTGYFSASTIDLGGSTIGVSSGGFTFTVAGSSTPTVISANGSSTSNTFTAPTVTMLGNLQLNSGLYVNGSLGNNGQFLQATGTGLTWTTLSASQISSSASNVTVTANYVNVAISGTNVAVFNSTGLSLTGNLSATNIVGSLTGNVTGSLTGTVLTTNQPNIISVGNLTSLSASGTIQTTGVIYGNSGLSGTILTASQTNITSVGNLTSLSASGVIQTIGPIFANSTATTLSPTTGALVVAGGVGIGGDLRVAGNLYVANITSTSYQTLTVTDSLLYLAGNVTYPYNYDIGFYSHYTGGVANAYVHTGLVRDYASNTWYLFSNIAEPSGGTMPIFGANVVYDPLTTGTHTVYGNVVPSANNIGYLGINGTQWQNIYATNHYGTIQTASQPNITLVGNLTSLATSGNISTTGYFLGNAALLSGLPAGYSNAQAASYLTVSNIQISSLGVGTGTFGNVGEIRATNNITAYYSDERLKTRLGAIENALDKVNQLSGFYHEANELAESLGYTKVREVGVSAQEVQRVLPEIVAPAPIDPQYLTVRYERLTPLLIEAIKELRKEVNDIKNDIKKLKGE